VKTKGAVDASRSKQAIRDRVWALLTRRRVARFPGAVGRIPNFVGAEAAARRLAESPAWQAARVVKCNPDAPQLPVRVLALKHGKRVFMAVPRLRDERCFLELDPRRLAGRERAAASIRGAGRLGTPTRPKDMPKIELIVAGSVAVRRDGARIGKGGGFSDLELAHDIPLDLIVTPDETIRCPRRHRRPRGIVWSALTDEKIAEVPLLARLARIR
jgi:5-formyltetrahydrofolate cyclo-ligase